MKVTVYKHISKVTGGMTMDVRKVLDRIKEGKSSGQIAAIRSENDAEKRRAMKSQLPSICFSGIFDTRTDQGLKQHSGLICLDFDHIPENEMKSFRDTIEGDSFTFACFTSPSGDGLKVLVRVPPLKENHKGYFDTLCEKWHCPYIDSKTSNISRVCYESFDPDLYFNENAQIWSEINEPDIEEIGTDSPSITLRSDVKIIDNLLKWWSKKYGATKGQRNNNLFILAAAFNNFGVNKSDAELQLMKFSQKDFTESEIQGLINSAYRKTELFETRFFEDTEVKHKIEKSIRAGKSEKQIKKEFSNIKEDEIELAINKIKENISITEFWTFDENGKIKLSPHRFKFFLQQRNFFKFYPEGSSGFMFVKIHENLLEKSSPAQIKDFVLEYLMTANEFGLYPYDHMADSTKYFKDDYLSFLDTAELNIKRDTEDRCFIYYNNCVVEITKTGRKEIDYIDLDGFVWKDQVINREFNEKQPGESVFQKFLWLISGQNEEKFNAFKSVIGYLLHSYKNSGNNKAIILNDETISDNPNGGSGKGVFWNALSHMKKLVSIDGKTFDFNKSFPYQTVSPDTQILVFDDVRKNFRFESLFSLITEGITIEKKGKDAIRVPVSRSPKILITTNYTIGGVGGSFERRKYELELSSYFNESRTPFDEFGHMMFDEWDQKEWNRFDHFNIECVQYYLRNGLTKFEYNNLLTRKFIKETSFEFYEWTKERDSEEMNIPLNERFSSTESMDRFLIDYPDIKKWMSQKRFKQWIESYAKFMDYEVESGKSQGQRWIQLSSSADQDSKPTKIEIEFDELPF